MDDTKRYQQGMKIRRAVLGDEHVDRAVAGTTDFNRDFQDFITRNAWGEIWTRPGLPRHTRSLLRDARASPAAAPGAGTDRHAAMNSACT